MAPAIGLVQCASGGPEGPPYGLDVIALRLGKPPKGFANWSLRLLAGHVVELGIVDTISHETIRQT
ncbi:MAG: helix-turn-helix domain-containing protein, partial [Planctomycetales bacterium]|nr:helix-turn-helix domain-containing protein [Planctomycetales bacterium]